MNVFYFLNYVIYEWYKKRDNIPLFYAMAAANLLIYFNIFSIIYWLSIFLNFEPPFTKVYAISFFIAQSILSYFLLYHNSRYKIIFAHFDEQGEKNRICKKYVFAYLILTIVFLLSTLVAADIRVDGHL
jgi:hypothetical protein